MNIIFLGEIRKRIRVRIRVKVRIRIRIKSPLGDGKPMYHSV